LLTFFSNLCEARRTRRPPPAAYIFFATGSLWLYKCLGSLVLTDGWQNILSRAPVLPGVGLLLRVPTPFLPETSTDKLDSTSSPVVILSFFPPFPTPHPQLVKTELLEFRCTLHGPNFPSGTSSLFPIRRLSDNRLTHFRLATLLPMIDVERDGPPFFSPNPPLSGNSVRSCPARIPRVGGREPFYLWSPPPFILQLSLEFGSDWPGFEGGFFLPIS